MDLSDMMNNLHNRIPYQKQSKEHFPYHKATDLTDGHLTDGTLVSC